MGVGMAASLAADQEPLKVLISYCTENCCCALVRGLALVIDTRDLRSRRMGGRGMEPETVQKLGAIWSLPGLREVAGVLPGVARARLPVLVAGRRARADRTDRSRMTELQNADSLRPANLREALVRRSGIAFRIAQVRHLTNVCPLARAREAERADTIESRGSTP
jgi:hypothetical protein